MERAGTTRAVSREGSEARASRFSVLATTSTGSQRSRREWVDTFPSLVCSWSEPRTGARVTGASHEEVGAGVDSSGVRWRPRGNPWGMPRSSGQAPLAANSAGPAPASALGPSCRAVERSRGGLTASSSGRSSGAPERPYGHAFRVRTAKAYRGWAANAWAWESMSLRRANGARRRRSCAKRIGKSSTNGAPAEAGTVRG